MMKQIWVELWVENKPLPLIIFKLALLMLLLFSGLSRTGFPYAIVILICMVSLESTAMRMECQAEYLIPRTSQEKKKHIVKKSALIAGIYSFCSSIGYVITISASRTHQWDKELMVFIPTLALFVFLSFFSVRLEMSGVISRVKRAMISKKIGKKFLMNTGIGVIGNFLAYVFILFFIQRKLGKIEELAVFGTNQWKMDLVIGSFIFIMLLWTVYVDYHGLNFGEFYEDE